MQISEVGQNAKPMGKAMRHVNLPRPFIAQFHSKPFAKSWGVFPDINRHIKYLSSHYRDNLRLRYSLGEVKTAEDVLRRTRIIVLLKLFQYTRCPVTLLLVGFQKKTALILKATRFDEQKAIKWGRFYIHDAHNIISAAAKPYRQ
jgi:hypothetical protein